MGWIDDIFEVERLHKQMQKIHGTTFRNAPRRGKLSKVRRAWQAVYWSSLVHKLCEICGRRVGKHAHHQNYDKPLSVNMLCCSCHMLVHSAVREIIVFSKEKCNEAK